MLNRVRKHDSFMHPHVVMLGVVIPAFSDSCNKFRKIRSSTLSLSGERPPQNGGVLGLRPLFVPESVSARFRSLRIPTEPIKVHARHL